MSRQRGFTVVEGLLVVIVVAVVGVASWYVFIRKDTVTQSASSTTDKTSISNSCFRIKTPANLPDSVLFKDTSTADSCKFVIQYKDQGDTPVGVGEVFSGSYAWQEKADLIPEGLAQGYELDLVDLGLLRTGKSSPMSVTKKDETTIDGQKAIIFTHDSRRSISGSATSIVIEAPSKLRLAGQPVSALFIWGVDNTQNGSLLQTIAKNLTWQD